MSFLILAYLALYTDLNMADWTGSLKSTYYDRYSQDCMQILYLIHLKNESNNNSSLAGD